MIASEVPIRTAYAAAAVELAKLFILFVGSTPVSATSGDPFYASLTTPHGPSTGGGVQNLQHIALSRGAQPFVVGSIDQGARILELRSYNQVATQYAARFRTRLPILAADYMDLERRARMFARTQQLDVVIKDVASPDPGWTHRLFSVAGVLALAAAGAFAIACA